MAVCQLISELTVNKIDIKSSVASYVGSKRYLKKIVPLSIVNILFWRTEIDRNRFNEKKIENFEFYTFSSKSKDPVIASVHKWTKSAMEALEKGYLKEMYFFITCKETSKVLESYKYKFSYKEENQQALKPSPDQVLEYTVNFFNTIRQLGNYNKLPTDIDFKIEITYTEDTPLDYEPPSFQAVDENPLLLDFKTSSNLLKVGYMDTGYHMVRCFGQGSAFSISRPETPMSNVDLVSDLNSVRSESIERHHMTEISSIVSVSERDPTSPTRDIDDIPTSMDIKCPCGIQLLIEEIDLIVCSICGLNQHAPCMKFYNAIQVPNNYVCTSCADMGHPMLEPELNNLPPEDRRQICVFRLIVLYSFITWSVAHKIITKLDVEEQQNIWNKLKRFKIYKVGENNTYKMGTHLDILICMKGLISKNIPPAFNYTDEPPPAQEINSLVLEDINSQHTVDPPEDSLALPVKKRRLRTLL